MRSKTMYGFPLSMVLFQIIGLILLSLFVVFTLFNIDLIIGIIAMGSIPIYGYVFIIRSEKKFIENRAHLLQLMICSAHLRGSENILDLGTGAGYVAIGFAKQLDQGKVFGIDKYGGKQQGLFSSFLDEIKINFFGNTLNNARENARIEHQQDAIDFIQGNLLNRFPFADGSFEVVVSSQCLYCIPHSNLYTVLAEIDRVLAPDGRLVLFESKQFLNWDLREVIEFYKKKGYDDEIISLKEFSNKVIYVGKKPDHL